MKRYLTGFAILLTGAALGAAAVETLHAQAKPLAFQIAEVTVHDQDGFNKDFAPLIGKVVTDAGGKFLARGGRVVSVRGTPAEPRIVVVQFDNFEKMQALFDSVAFKQAVTLGDKYATQRVFGVEGVSP
jgi:uncharacterized protein (DUF1330 family)